MDSPQRREFPVERTVLITPDAGRPETLFYRVGGLAVDRAHNLYVLDNGAATINVFDPSGAHLRSIGNGRGQGPGQLGDGGHIAVADGRVYYISADRRLLIWSSDGELLDTRPMRYRVHSIKAAPGGILAASWRSNGDFPYTLQIGLLQPDGGVASLTGLARHPPYVVMQGSRTRGVSEIPTPASDYAVSPGRLYVTKSDRYDVLAFDMETHEQLWLLKVERPESEVRRSDRQAVLASVRERVPDVDDGDIDWPSHYPALAVPRPGLQVVDGLKPIFVDGNSRLFVFPFAGDGARARLYPVDVYDADGARIAVGSMPRISAVAARGEFIYGFQSNDQDEIEIVRYRVTIDGGPN